MLKPVPYRAVSVIRYLRPRPKTKVETPLSFPVDALLFATEHAFHEEEDDMRQYALCVVKLAMAESTSPLARQFLMSPCKPFKTDEFGLVMPIGNKFTHPTHQLRLAVWRSLYLP